MSDQEYMQALRVRFNSGEPLDFIFFWGHQPSKKGVSASCFSQWYEAPFLVDGFVYPTAEHYMMAEKARLFGDEETLALVLSAKTPKDAKALGRKVIGFDEQLWLENRFSIVTHANQEKFAQNPELAEFLLNTGAKILVEASPVDAIWGIGLAQDDARARDPNLWPGLNLLGFSLMRVRDLGLGRQ